MNWNILPKGFDPNATAGRAWRAPHGQPRAFVTPPPGAYYWYAKWDGNMTVFGQVGTFLDRPIVGTTSRLILWCFDGNGGNEFAFPVPAKCYEPRNSSLAP